MGEGEEVREMEAEAGHPETTESEDQEAWGDALEELETALSAKELVAHAYVEDPWMCRFGYLTGEL